MRLSAQKTDPKHLVVLDFFGLNIEFLKQRNLVDASPDPSAIFNAELPSTSRPNVPGRKVWSICFCKCQLSVILFYRAIIFIIFKEVYITTEQPSFVHNDFTKCYNSTQIIHCAMNNHPYIFYHFPSSIYF